MKKTKIASYLKAIFSNTWTITIFATMIGMFSGIYLNGYLREREANTKYQIAIAKIEQELKSNAEIIIESKKFHETLYETFKFFYENTNSEGSLVVTSKSMNNFKNKFPNTISILDSVKLEEDLYLYRGQIEIELSSLPSIEISEIAWQLFKDTELKYKIDYDCLYSLTVVYNLQSSVVKENNVLLNYLNGQLDKGENGDKFLTQFKLLIDYEKALIQYYDSIDELDCS